MPRRAYHLQDYRWKWVKIPEAQLESTSQLDAQGNPLIAQQPHREQRQPIALYFSKAVAQGGLLKARALVLEA